MRLFSQLLRPSLRLRVGFVGVVLLVAGLGALAYHVAISQREALAESAKADYLGFARSLGALVRPHVVRGEREKIAELLAEVVGPDRENVRYAVVEDVWGQPFATVGRAPPQGAPVLVERVATVAQRDSSVAPADATLFEAAVPVLEEGVRFGAVRVGVSTRLASGGLPSVLVTAAPPILIGLGVFAALAFLVDLRIRSILSNFIQAARRVASGDLEHPIDVSTGDELEELAKAFNSMAGAIRDRDAELRRAKETLEHTVEERTRQLSEEKGRLDTIVGAVGAGMLLLDPSLRVVWTNRVAREWYGDGAQLLGGPCPWGGTEVDPRCPACPSRRALASGRPHVEDALPVRIDGVERYFTVIASPVRDSEGRVTEVLELLLDVTRRRELEADLVQAAKLTSVGELAGGLAHEIGNPVGVISAKVKLLLRAIREGQTPRKLESDLQAIERHAERIAAITGKLLSFARRAPGLRSEVRIGDVVQEAVALLEHRLIARQVDLTIEGADAVPPIHANRTELVQVFVNLIQNAIDAMPHGGQIRVEAGERQGALHVLVCDTGTGMSSAVQERAFQPFFTTKDPGHGTGLGLSISQRIVNDHGGTLTLETRPGEGTTLAVRLPVRQEQDVA